MRNLNDLNRQTTFNELICHRALIFSTSYSGIHFLTTRNECLLLIVAFSEEKIVFHFSVPIYALSYTGLVSRTIFNNSMFHFILSRNLAIMRWILPHSSSKPFNFEVIVVTFCNMIFEFLQIPILRWQSSYNSFQDWWNRSLSRYNKPRNIEVINYSFIGLEFVIKLR